MSSLSKFTTIRGTENMPMGRIPPWFSPTKLCIKNILFSKDVVTFIKNQMKKLQSRKSFNSTPYLIERKRKRRSYIVQAQPYKKKQLLSWNMVSTFILICFSNFHNNNSSSYLCVKLFDCSFEGCREYMPASTVVLY